MEYTYKGFLIRTVNGHVKYANDWIVSPINHPEQEELFEGMTREDVENQIDTLVN